MPKKIERSCFTCEHFPVCKVRHGVEEVTRYWSWNIDGDAAPGQWMGIYRAIGRCCLVYDPRDEHHLEAHRLYKALGNVRIQNVYWSKKDKSLVLFLSDGETLYATAESLEVA
jgi:hypothetical protein